MQAPFLLQLLTSACLFSLQPHLCLFVLSTASQQQVQAFGGPSIL